MLNEAVQQAINAQINNELNSMYSYLSMSAYCEHKLFRGCAHWMRLQSHEEYTHAMRLYDFLIARQGLVKLQPIAQPQIDFGSVPEVFQKALEQEQQVTSQINALYELAFKEKAFAALVELEWFINEQVEEERTARDVVHKFELVNGDPAAMLDLDRELGLAWPSRPRRPQRRKPLSIRNSPQRARSKVARSPLCELRLSVVKQNGRPFER